MPDVQKEDSLDPNTALSNQLETAIEKAGTLADFTDIKKVNALFEKYKWSLEEKIKTLVGMTKMKSKPAVVRAAINMLDKTKEDAIARSDLVPRPTELPTPQAGSADQVGIPKIEDVESIELMSQTMRLNFNKDQSNGPKTKEIQSTTETKAQSGDTDSSGPVSEDDTGTTNIIDRPATSDTEAVRGDERPEVGGSVGDSADADPGSTEGAGDLAPGDAGDADPDQQAYFQDDRDSGALHRKPTAGYGVRSSSI